ncbi:MAG: hypothetical protein GY754_09305 [bacterium]|nr:hypothetical protein [bacterium]
MAKILFSSICQPLGPKYGDGTGVGAELFNGQITQAQGLFCPRTVLPHFPLDYIANNIKTSSVVLQFPTKRKFIRELKKGYEYIGITFNLCTFHKARQMVEWIREYSPKSKIILGGYGTRLSDEELAPYSDYICREEGVGFMRNLLGESEPNGPHQHPLITITLKACSIPVAKNAIIFGSLGCPNGCDFCATSHYYDKKVIRLLPEPEDLVNLIEQYLEMDPTVGFSIFDEDFLQNEKWARRFHKLMKARGKKPPTIFVLSSIRAVSKFTIEELLEMGISMIWVGYEGKRSGYAKQQGKEPSEFIQELREHGIQVLASYILGFDYQNKEIIRSEVNELLAMKCCFHQFLIYGPTPGTPFHDRVEKEDRFIEEYKNDSFNYYHKCTGFYSMVKHPSIGQKELEDLQTECYKKDFEVLGPSLVRGLETRLLGYKKLVNHSNSTCREIAESYKKEIELSLPICLTARLLGPSKEARKQAKEVLIDAKKTLGLKTGVMHKTQSFVFLCAALWTSLCLKMDWFQQPYTITNKYNDRGA